MPSPTIKVLTCFAKFSRSRWRAGCRLRPFIGRLTENRAYGVHDSGSIAATVGR